MAKIIVEGSQLAVRLSMVEKVAAMRGSVRVPLSSVRSVDVEGHPMVGLRGIRAPGTGIPGVISFGVRRFGGGRDFVAVIAKRPAVRIELDDSSPFSRLVVSVADAEATVSAVRAATAT